MHFFLDELRSDLVHPERVQTDVQLMYIDSELERQVKLVAMSLLLVDEALDDIKSEEEEEEQFARDQTQWDWS